jgi:hypothetical protein
MRGRILILASVGMFVVGAFASPAQAAARFREFFTQAGAGPNGS